MTINPNLPYAPLSGGKHPAMVYAMHPTDKHFSLAVTKTTLQITWEQIKSQANIEWLVEQINSRQCDKEELRTLQQQLDQLTKEHQARGW